MHFAALCHPAELRACSAPPFCDGDIEKERKECLLVFSRIHPKCSVALERMWDGFVTSPDDLSHVIQGVSNERALLFMRAVFAKALKPSPSPTATGRPAAPISAPAPPCVSHRPSGLAESKRPSLTPSPLAPVYPSHAEGKRPSLVRGGGYGLDVAIAEKIAAKYDADSEAKMIAWISAVTRLEPRSDETFAEWLKNG